MTTYQPIMDAVAAELTARAAANHPLRVNIWDGAHHSPVARQILNDPALRQVASGFGTPAYVVELSDVAEWLSKDFVQHRTSTPPVQRALENKVLYSRTLGADHLRDMLRPLYEVSRTGTVVVFPDPRVQKKDMPSLTREEQRLYDHAQYLMKNISPVCAGTVQEAYAASLSKAEKASEQSLQRKLNIMYSGGHGDGSVMDTTELDQIISERVTKALPEQGMRGKTIPITVYGAAHFMKANDLNEHLPGVDLAVFDAPADAALAFRAVHGAVNLPHYVWYGEKEQLVKLDNDAAKMDFLGLESPAALRQWEQKGFEPAAIAVVAELPEAVKDQCAGELARFRLYQRNDRSQGMPMPVAPQQAPSWQLPR